MGVGGSLPKDRHSTALARSELPSHFGQCSQLALNRVDLSMRMLHAYIALCCQCKTVRAHIYVYTYTTMIMRRPRLAGRPFLMHGSAHAQGTSIRSMHMILEPLTRGRNAYHMFLG